jgi:transposase
MFKPKSTQSSIFQTHLYLPDKLRNRLKESWAEVFRKDIMPIIPEEEFSELYSENMGRPCVPVALLIGLSILKEMFNCSDEKLIEELYFNIMVQYALQVDPFEAEISIRTLYNFRERIMDSPAIKETFFSIVNKIIKENSIKTSFQRLDSKHFYSNMARLTRLQLFVRTVEKFLKSLDPSYIEDLPEDLRRRYLEREGYFADAAPNEAQRSLIQTAEDILFLLNHFSADDSVTSLETFALLERLFHEQCYQPKDSDKALPRPADEISSDSLQNPSDPDATYDGHKGEGYQVQIAESCNSDNPFQVVTDFETENANESDQNALMPIIEDLEDQCLKPDIMAADAGYVSGKNILDSEEQDVVLLGPLTTGRSSDNDKLSLADFHMDIEDRIFECPQGAPAIFSSENEDGSIQIQFDCEHCKECPVRDICPVNQRGRLTYTREKAATARRKREQQSQEFKEAYKIRSGIEATNSELNRAYGAKKVWTRGFNRVNLAMAFKVMALNIRRFARYATEQIRLKASEIGNLGERCVQNTA